MIATAHLFTALDEKLIALLRQLQPSDWHRPTLAKLWTVKDVAAHLLDVSLRRLSIQRDGYTQPAPAFTSYDGLVQYLNTLNAEWVAAFKRVSPPMLVELLAHTGPQFSALMQQLAQQPHAPALYAVSWAGEERSEMWMDIAREYTEKWIHQQQIREAVGATGTVGIESKELYHPVLSTWLLALPYTYHNTRAELGTVLEFKLTGEAGGTWQLLKQEKGWSLTTDALQTSPSCSVTIAAALAWKIFAKHLRMADVLHEVEITGNASLAAPFLNLVAVMA